MTLTKQKIKEIVDNFGTKPNDSGSASVQIALLTEKIHYLSKHLTANPKDYSSQRGLLKLVSRRKHMLGYLEKHNKEEYKKLIKQLGLRK